MSQRFRADTARHATTNRQSFAPPAGGDQFGSWQTRELPAAEMVRPGLWSLPVPMADNPLRYSFCYAFSSGADLVLVDPGWPDDRSYGALVAGLALANHRIDDVTGVLVTHAHHDHFGLAPRVREESGAWVALAEADSALLTLADDDFEAVLKERRAWLRRCGADREQAVHFGGDVEQIARAAAATRPTHPLEHGDIIRVGRFELEAISTPGHSPGHTVFLERAEQVLLSGDHLLPRITSNVSAFVGHDANVLTSYLDSLAKVRDLAVDEVLPGHEYRFTGLHDRCDVVAAHHERRVDEIARRFASASVMSPWEISEGLSWSRPWDSHTSFSRRAAVAETLAHLHLLSRRGVLELIKDSPTLLWQLAP